MTGLDHIGIAVKALEKSLETYTRVLGFTHRHTEEVPTEKVRVAMIYSGETRVELLEPTSADSPISQFLSKRGEGIHHLAFGTKDIAKDVNRLRKEGAQLIEPAPRPGAEGSQVAFIHPKSTGGILIELVQRNNG